MKIFSDWENYSEDGITGRVDWESETYGLEHVEAIRQAVLEKAELLGWNAPNVLKNFYICKRTNGRFFGRLIKQIVNAREGQIIYDMTGDYVYRDKMFVRSRLQYVYLNNISPRYLYYTVNRDEFVWYDEGAGEYKYGYTLGTEDTKYGTYGIDWAMRDDDIIYGHVHEYYNDTELAINDDRGAYYDELNEEWVIIEGVEDVVLQEDRTNNILYRKNDGDNDIVTGTYTNADGEELTVEDKEYSIFDSWRYDLTVEKYLLTFHNMTVNLVADSATRHVVTKGGPNSSTVYRPFYSSGKYQHLSGDGYHTWYSEYIAQWVISKCFGNGRHVKYYSSEEQYGTYTSETQFSTASFEFENISGDYYLLKVIGEEGETICGTVWFSEEERIYSSNVEAHHYVRCNITFDGSIPFSYVFTENEYIAGEFWVWYDENTEKWYMTSELGIMPNYWLGDSITGDFTHYNDNSVAVVSYDGNDALQAKWLSGNNYNNFQYRTTEFNVESYGARSTAYSIAERFWVAIFTSINTFVSQDVFRKSNGDAYTTNDFYDKIYMVRGELGFTYYAPSKIYGTYTKIADYQYKHDIEQIYIYRVHDDLWYIGENLGSTSEYYARIGGEGLFAVFSYYRLRDSGVKPFQRIDFSGLYYEVIAFPWYLVTGGARIQLTKEALLDAKTILSALQYVDWENILLANGVYYFAVSRKNTITVPFIRDTLQIPWFKSYRIEHEGTEYTLGYTGGWYIDDTTVSLIKHLGLTFVE